MKAEPLTAAIEATGSGEGRPHRVLLSPQGRVLTGARRPASCRHGRRWRSSAAATKGVDERVRDFVDEEISIGDYVVSGGEIAAVVLIDAVARLVPGVLGCAESPDDESFSHGLLEYPQYTRPPEFRGARVPDVLLSGNHGEIAAWRRRQALRRTRLRRPDLLDSAPLSDEDRAFLESLSDDE